MHGVTSFVKRRNEQTSPNALDEKTREVKEEKSLQLFVVIFRAIIGARSFHHPERKRKAFSDCSSTLEGVYSSPSTLNYKMNEE